MSKIEKDRQFRPLPISSVAVGGFWGVRQETICERTADILLDRCMAAGMLKQIDVDQPSPGVIIPYVRQHGPVTTQMFWDSDFGKSIEAAAYSLYRRRNPTLEARIDHIIDLYGKLQMEDGYLNSWFQRIEPGRRWKNLRDTHELYCAGHLMEGAVAYYQATGKRKLLDIMCRYADHMISVFGHGEGQIPGYCGHEEIELALVKLSRTTGEKKYLDLAKYFIDERGHQPPHFFDDEAIRDGRNPAEYAFKTYEYSQSHKPVREQDKVVGHAVRAMYLYSGMADIATEYNDDTLTSALETLWSDLTTKQMYITGGIGPSADNEGFTDYYDLPNQSAYAETCAAVSLVFWANRMLGRGPNRRFADIMEIALYNGSLSGLSLDGTRFFYENPLESRGDYHHYVWHRCPCCPPNISRLVASVGSYMYAVAHDEIAVHLYGESSVKAEVAGTKIELSQATRYPWHGAVRLTLKVEKPTRFAISLRIPGWAKGVKLSIDGGAVDLASVTVDGYARIEHEWTGKEVIDLELPLIPRALWADPRVRQDTGRFALMRGPLVYCAEGVDNGEDLNALTVTGDPARAGETVVEALGGAVALELDATRDIPAGFEGALYRETPPAAEPTKARFVPYHLWDNRALGEMLVWMRGSPNRQRA